MLLVRCVLILLILLTASIQAIKVEYQASAASFYPGVKAYHKNGSSVWKAALNYNNNKLFPYVYYGKENRELQIAGGALLNFSTPDNLYRNSYFDSSLCIGSEHEPFSVNYFLLPEKQYFYALFYNMIGLSILYEETENSYSYLNNKTTYSLFGQIDLPKYYLNTKLKSAIYFSSAQEQFPNSSTTAYSAKGYHVSAKIPLNINIINNEKQTHIVGVSKTYWDWKDGIAPVSSPESYFLYYYQALSELKNQVSADNFTLEYEGVFEIDPTTLSASLKKSYSPNIYLAQCGGAYKFNRYTTFSLSFFKCSSMPGITILANLVFKECFFI
jgi:hypothetical protein